MKALVAVVFLGLLPSSMQAQTAGKPVTVDMRNVLYHFTGSVAVQIRTLHGQLVPKHELPVFDDKESFTIAIETAEIAMSANDLANVMNS